MAGDEAKLQAWYSFVEAHRAVTAVLEEELALAGLTPTSFELLRCLERAAAGTVSLAELAAVSRMSRSCVASACRGLLRDGLVTRERQPGDGRTTLVRITPAGRMAMKRAAPIHLAVIRTRFLDAFTLRGARDLRGSMSRVLQLDERAPRRPVSAGPASAGRMRGRV